MALLPKQHDHYYQTIHAAVAALRDDIQNLKQCQIQYFALSITGTGAVLGFAKVLGGSGPHEFTFLVPLIIVLPCWVIFFDKATTITRNIGYQRILEELLCAPKSAPFRYVGFETALAEYRAQERAEWKEIERKNQTGMGINLWKFALTFVLGTRHRYWMINWYTFFMLSCLCLAGATDLFLKKCIGVFSQSAGLALVAALLVSMVAFIYTIWMLYHLVLGRQSYENCAKIWRKILAHHPS